MKCNKSYLEFKHIKEWQDSCICILCRCLKLHADCLKSSERLKSDAPWFAALAHEVRNSQANIQFARHLREKRNSSEDLNTIEKLYLKKLTQRDHAGNFWLANFYYASGKFARAFQVARAGLAHQTNPDMHRVAVSSDELLEATFAQRATFHCVVTKHSARVLPPGFRYCFQLGYYPPLGEYKRSASVAVLDARFMLSYIYVASAAKLLRVNNEARASVSATTEEGVSVDVELTDVMEQLHVLEDLASQQQRDDNERRQALYYNALAELYIMLSMSQLALSALDRSVRIVPVSFRNPGVRRRRALKSSPVGMLHLSAIVTAVDDVSNDDGTWIRLDEDSRMQFCEDPDGECWALVRDGDGVAYLEHETSDSPAVLMPTPASAPVASGFDFSAASRRGPDTSFSVFAQELGSCYL